MAVAACWDNVLLSEATPALGEVFGIGCLLDWKIEIL
jgi:hypothetical protein